MLKRFAARLLFQFRVVSDGRSNKMRTVEERTIIARAASWAKAEKHFNAYLERQNFEYMNSDGNKVFFEAIGISDMLELGPETDEHEVWYDIKTILLPMENRNKLMKNFKKQKPVRAR